MEKELMLDFLEREIEYYAYLINTFGNDGMSYNRNQGIINELELIKEKVAKDLISESGTEGSNKISNILGMNLMNLERRQKEEGTQSFFKDIGKPHKWQTYEMKEIKDMVDVIQNMLIWDFAVNIGGHFYDINFFRDKATSRISYSWSSAPSPHLTSYDIIQLAFTEGIWYRIRTNKRKE